MDFLQDPRNLNQSKSIEIKKRIIYIHLFALSLKSGDGFVLNEWCKTVSDDDLTQWRNLV